MLEKQSSHDHEKDAKANLYKELMPLHELSQKLVKIGYERFDFDQKNQYENAFCALILAFNNDIKDTVLHTITDALPAHDAPFDEGDFFNVMTHMGYYTRPVDMDMCQVDTRLLPALFMSKEGQIFVLLNHPDPNMIKIFNPRSLDMINRRRDDRFEATLSGGRFWFFKPFLSSKNIHSKFMRQTTGKSWFRSVVGRFCGTFTQIMAAGFILNIMALATPLFIILVYDRVIAAKSLETLPMLICGMVLAIVFEAMFRFVRSRGLAWFAGRMDYLVGTKIFNHLIGLPPSLIESASVSAQIARIKTFENVRDFFSSSLFLSLLELPFSVVACVIIYIIAGPLVAVPIAIAALYMALFFAVRRPVKVTIRLAAKASSARQSFTLETFEKIRAIRCYGLAERWQMKYRDVMAREMMSHFRLNWLGMVAETLSHALTLLSIVATLGFGVHLVWTGAMSTGALVASMILVWRVLTPFYSLCSMIPRLEQIRNSILQVDKLIDLDTEQEMSSSKARLPIVQGQIELSDIKMRYAPNLDPIFKGFSCKIDRGNLVALTGGSDSGKSTLLKILQSLYPLEEGQIKIDGFNIKQLDTLDVRQKIAYVPQNPTFFKGTLRENMRFTNPLATDSDIEQALILADVWDEVRALPAGVNTLMGGYDGAPLSASMKTRLCLAQAYLHPSRLILIDELPNSLLSEKAGQNLKKYLSRIKGHKTCVMVTFRRDFMRMADMIIRMENRKKPVILSPEDMFQPRAVPTNKEVA